MAPHSSTLAWKIPWMEEPGRLQSMRSLRVRHNWATSLSCIGEGNGNPLQCSCLENPRDVGAWWAAVYGVAQSWTWLMRLSSSSSSRCLKPIFHIDPKASNLSFLTIGPNTPLFWQWVLKLVFYSFKTMTEIMTAVYGSSMLCCTL